MTYTQQRWCATDRLRYFAGMKGLMPQLFDPPPPKCIGLWKLMIATEPDAEIRASAQAVLDALPQRVGWK